MSKNQPHVHIKWFLQKISLVVLTKISSKLTIVLFRAVNGIRQASASGNVVMTICSDSSTKYVLLQLFAFLCLFICSFKMLEVKVTYCC